MSPNHIVLLSGPTGAGTSTVALEIAKRANIQTIVSTDAIREVIRATVAPDLNPALAQSTYLAGQTENYEQKSEEVRRAEILRAYKMQSAAVGVGVSAVIERARTESIGIIVEGVHLIPDRNFHSRNQWIRPAYIEVHDEAEHLARFQSREDEAPMRRRGKYTDNFQEIRWIQQYLRRKAREAEIPMISNDGPLERTVTEAYEALF